MRALADAATVQAKPKPVAQLSTSSEPKLYGLHKELFELSGGRCCPQPPTHRA